MTETPGNYLSQVKLTFTLLGQVVPKARPRFKSGQGGFLPQRYREWKQGAIGSLRVQSRDLSNLPIASAQLQIDIYGSRRGDLDNLCGSICDALVQAGILKNDSVSCVPSMQLNHFFSKASEARAIVSLGEFT